MHEAGKNSSHGTYITRIPQQTVSKWDKTVLSVIHPLPAAKPRQPHHGAQTENMEVSSKTYSAKCRFQSGVEKKPISQQFSKPFLYIQKVLQKQKVDAKLAKMGKLDPFIISKRVRPVSQTTVAPAPEGYANLFQYEEDKRKQAAKLFRKLHQIGVTDIKNTFLLWQGKAKKTTPDIQVREKQFVDFIKQLAPAHFVDKQLKHFFKLYATQLGKEKKEEGRTLSIKAFSFNYSKFVKSESEPANLLSKKAAKDRYLLVREYNMQFETGYPALQNAMQMISQYEESLRRHFLSIFNSYLNPFEAEINELRGELQKPIIKYDKHKKSLITSKIAELTDKNDRLHESITAQYHSFSEAYEASILPNHDLFFTKRTVNKLLMPLIKSHPHLTKRMIEEAVEAEQARKQRYLECLSDFMVEMDRDKKVLQEDTITLEEFVDMVLMRKKAKSALRDKNYEDEFVVYAMKKLVREIKKQFLLKNDFQVENFDQFPADQEIPLQLVHTCFEMECSKVLLKHRIWTELLDFLPVPAEPCPALHRLTIEANLCLDFLWRYLSKIDERIRLEMNKSKQVSLITEKVDLHTFGEQANVILAIEEKMKSGCPENDDEKEEKEDKVEPLKRVSFADVVDRALIKEDKPETYEIMLRREQEKEREECIRRAMRAIFEEPPSPSKHRMQVTQLMQGNQSQIDQLAKESGVLEGRALDTSLLISDLGYLNTNSFDIRFYEKQRQHGIKADLEENVRMGTSRLLANVPHLGELSSTDPLKISTFLLGNIDKSMKEQQRSVKQKHFDLGVREGVDHNYFQQKIKLQNKPTVYDSEGRSKYSVLLPVGYYESVLASQNVPDKQKWFLRPHHVETLTENTLSKKDNILNTEYQSKLEHLPAKKRPDEFIIQENVERKTSLIESLEQRIAALKGSLQAATRGSRVKGGATIPTSVLNNYLRNITDGKEDKQLEMGVYEGVLYDLRRKQRELLNDFREGEEKRQGVPEERWWQRKDSGFNNELRKDRLMVADGLKSEPTHKNYVGKLNNRQIY